MLTLFKLLLFGTTDPIFAGSGNSDAMLVSSFKGFPLEINAAESNCNSQPSSKFVVKVLVMYDNRKNYE